jgi:hypothetical protein
MTLRELKGKWMREIRNLKPDAVIPDASDLMKEAVRETLKPSGGLKLTATITTVAGQAEYGSSSGFPLDLLKVERVYDGSTGYTLDPMEKTDRNESPVTGGISSRYYIWGSLLGLDPVPIDARAIKLDYLGSGTDVAVADEATVALLSQIPVQDNDNFWNTAVFYAAMVYYRIDGNMEKMGLYKQLFHEARWEATKQIISYNASRTDWGNLPTGYFGNRERTSLQDRIGEDGDIIRQF